MKNIRTMIRRLRTLFRQFCGWFSWSWERLLGEPGYADAVAATAVALVETFCRNHQVKRLAREAARIFTLLVRIVRASQCGLDYEDGSDEPDEGLSWA